MDLDNKDWYKSLLDDCKAIVVEYGFVSRFARVEGYHALGQRIINENGQFERSQIYGHKIVEKVAKALNLSPRSIHYAVQFYQKYPDLNALPAGKDITWGRVVRELLPENPIPKEKKKITCPKCQFSW